MSFTNLIRRLAYLPYVVKTVQFLHISNIMSRLYYLLTCPRDKVKKISFEGIEASFNVNNYGELRYIEGTFTKGYRDERFVLERLIKILQDGDVAYDIGASLGIHTILMANKVGKNGHIIAFEPDTKSYEKLCANINLNALNNVTPVQIALGSDFAEAMLYRCSLIDNLKTDQGHKVNIMPGDFFVRDRNLPLPEVIKIDVEGYEYFVIKGLQETLSDKTCQMVCCEVHPTMLPPEIKSEMIIESLKSLGFNRIETFPHRYTLHAFCYKD